jgi:hypothetical protein
MIGEDIECSAVLGDNPATVLTHHHPQVIGREKPYLTVGKFLNHHTCAIDEPNTFELTRK